MAEWIISGNPKIYNIIDAFHELGKLNWAQSTNIKPGDIVYIYVSGDIKAIRFKCRANKTDLKEVEIDDREYDVSGEDGGSYGRYMELEMIEEYFGEGFTREELMKHGFRSPQSPVHIKEEVKAYIESLPKGESSMDKKKYSVNEAVWIAAALLSAEVYENNPDCSKEDMYFKQAKIVHLAETLTEGNVDAARCSWWCCADKEQSVHNFLRGDLKENDSLRRLCCMDEFPDKTYPTNLNMEDGLTMNGHSITMEELFYFVREQFPAIIKSGSGSEKSVKAGKLEGMKQETGFDKNLILYGPPGTGKTYKSAIYAVAICDGKSVDALVNYKEVMERYNKLKSEGRIVFTTFHQSYGYEEFIEGIKPMVDTSTSNIGYKIESGVFKKFCEKAGGVEVKTPYVFIIDEINRGNISKIFGELITLIETTKRAGMPEAASAVLPYSGIEFSVPSNVYILGTMNTADRSIALMDTALRRRFRFVEMMPDIQVLRDIGANMVEDLDVAAMLEKMNERITLLYDREHTIGHAFFTGLRGENATIEKLQSIFEKSVIPLLQEYFYEDYQNIQLVLGDNAKSSPELKFIRDDKVVAKDIFKGNVDEVIDLPEKSYSINKEALGNLDSYKEIL